MLSGWLWWVVPLIVTVALYGLALRQTAEVAAGGVVVALVLTAGTASVLGESPRSVTGVTLLAAGLAAVAWALGRARRRGRAKRRAVAVFRAASPDVPAVAAEAERHRLAAELHDTAAHSTSPASRSAPPPPCVSPTRLSWRRRPGMPPRPAAWPPRNWSGWPPATSAPACPISPTWTPWSRHGQSRVSPTAEQPGAPRLRSPPSHAGWFARR
ncbi:histidine kinase [Microbispora sp. GKU 823]|uniref:histidine kinase n=1 Tax=Microbispora sp. GKU 823 TaxID=1652100 RepID=UPI0009A3ED67|nr:histidine kinase [Microbispora sp. GKU 823]OPG12321.1 hypothetical protein B1L11_14885 [Microbispora sp. GKU 823]